MSTMHANLLPCPMCAGKVREPVAKPIGHGEVCFAVSCNCGLSFDGGQDIESAVRTWNRRAIAAPAGQGDPVAWAHEYGLAGVSVAAKTTWPSFVSASSNRSDCDGVMIPLFRGKPAHAVAMTDDQILEVMRLSITAADGGYVYDMSPEYVIAAGRSLLEVASLLDIKQSPVAVVMLE